MRGLVMLALALHGCAEEGDGTTIGASLTDPSAPLPATIRELGVFPAAPDLDVTPEGALPYAVAYPLWSNGSEKRRHLVLPPEEVIDTADPDAWAFPVGTSILKTFVYGDAPVETRVLRRTGEGDWEYAAYEWTADGTDAVLLDLDGRVSVPQEGFAHTIPARLDCRACHDHPTQAHPVLGLSRAQMSTTTVSELESAGVLSASVQAAPAIEAASASATAVLRFFYGNCVHCHHGGEGDNASFDLRPDVALANTVDQPTASSASAAGTRIVPGDPGAGVLFQAVSGEHDDPEVEDMPPVGVDVRDAASIEALRAFITELPT